MPATSLAACGPDRAKSRHAPLTGQPAHSALACAALACSPFSGKKMSGSGTSRQAACSSQPSLAADSGALTFDEAPIIVPAPPVRQHQRENDARVAGGESLAA